MRRQGRWRVLDRYVAREIGGGFAAGLGLFVVVVTFLQLLRLLDHGHAVGLGARELLTATVYALPPLLGLLVPISWLYACLLGVGRLAQDREVLALMQAGVAPGVLFRVPLRGGLLLAVLSAALLVWGEPWGVRGLSALLAGSAQRALSTGLQPQTFYGVGGGLTVYAEAAAAGELQGLVIAERRDGRAVTLFAERAAVSRGPGAGEVTFLLRDGTVVFGEPDLTGAKTVTAGADATQQDGATPAPPAGAATKVTREDNATPAPTAGLQTKASLVRATAPAAAGSPTPAVTQRGPTFVDFAKGRYRLQADALVRAGRRSFTDDQGLSLAQLWRAGYGGNGHNTKGALARVILQRKLALPLAAPIFGALAVALGIGTPSGARGGARARSLLCSCAIVGSYYYVGRSLELAARRGALSAALAAWLPDALGLLALAGLWWWRRGRVS